MSKKCSKCQEFKDESEFHKNGKGRFRSDCKRCRTETVLASRNPKEASRHSLAYYYRDRETLSQRSLEHYYKNIDQIKAYRKSYRRRAESKTLAQVRGSRYRAKRTRSDGDFTDEQWRLLCVKYDYTCPCCHTKAEDTPEGTLTIDHVVPLCKGGSNSISNIQPLCKLCNCKKGRKTIDYRAW